MSEINTPTSTSTSATATGNDSLTLAEEVKKYNTVELISFLRGQEDLQLDEDDLEIIRKRKINGRAFLKTTKEDFERYGLEGGPATNLADFAKECKEKKLRPFSSYLSLSEVLEKYDIGSDGIDSIPLFKLQTHEIQDDNRVYKRCMEEILSRLRSYGTLQPDSLEAMRNEYVVALLHTAIHIVMDETDKKLSMRPQYGIVGEKSKGRVDYVIKDAEDLLCVAEDKQHKLTLGFAQNIVQLESAHETNKRKRKRADDFDYIYGIVTTGQDWHFLLYTPGVISKGSKVPFTIVFTDDALKEDSEEYHTLCKDVKKVLGVIVGLLKDRACSDEEPDRKKAKIDGYRSKK